MEACCYTHVMVRDQAVFDGWSAAAPFWEKHREIIRQMFAPLTEALSEDGMIAGGHTVLDIASGPGEPALGLAALVGPQGRIFGIDPIPEMVVAARRAANRRGITNARFEVAFAEDLPFPADTFDAVVSRFGAMFFSSAITAVREILRVLKPEGKLALAVWDFAERNPFFSEISRIVERHVDSPPPGPDDPDAFRFASPGKLRNLLVEAGADGPSERVVQFPIHAPVSIEDFWTMRCEMSEKLREKLSTLSAEQLTDVRHQALEALRKYSTESGMNFPAQVLIVRGAKAGPQSRV